MPASTSAWEAAFLASSSHIRGLDAPTSLGWPASRRAHAYIVRGGPWLSPSGASARPAQAEALAPLLARLVYENARARVPVAHRAQGLDTLLVIACG